MKSEFKTVGRHAMVYAIGVVLGKLASFLMLPIYTRYLSTSDYGVLELLSMTVDVIGMIASVGLASGIFKFHAEFDDPADKRQVISTVGLGSLGLALLTCVTGLVFAEPLSHLLFGAGANPQYLRMYFLIYFFQAAGAPGLLVMRIQQRSVLFVAFNLAKLLLHIALNVYLLVFRGLGLPGVIAGNLVLSILTAAVLATYTYRHAGFAFSIRRFRQMARFGAPLMVFSFGSFILTFSDRFFLNYLSDTSTVGIYALAYRFSFVLSALAVMPFQQIWDPRRFEVAKRPDANRIYRRMFFYLNLSLIGGATVMALFVEDVIRIVAAPAFRPAHWVVPLILVATIIQQWTAYCNIGLFLRDKTRLYARSAIVGVAAALALNALLIPPLGMIGAAWATVFAYGARFAVVYRLSQREYHIDYDWGRTGGLVVIAAATVLTRLAMPDVPLTTSVPISTALVALAITAGYRLLNAGERAEVRSFLSRRVLLRPVPPAEAAEMSEVR